MVAAGMCGFDTNLIVRLLTGDDTEQERLVRERLLAAQAAHRPVFIALIVLAEVGHVLAGPRYRLPRERIADAIDGLLATAVFTLERRDVVTAALQDYRTGRGSLADHLIGRSGEAAGADVTLTFDRDLHRSPLFAPP